MRRLTFIVGLAVAVTGCAPSSPASPSYVVPLTVTQVRTGEPLSSAVTLVHPGEPLSSTHLKGEHETPPHDTLAQGQSVMTVSADGQSISFKLMASNIDNVVASHIHVGPIGSPGPIVVSLYSTAAGGGRHNGILAEGEFGAANLVGPLAGQPLSALLAQMDAGNTYVNVHTNDGVAPTNTGPGDFASGEIRGQIVRK